MVVLPDFVSPFGAPSVARGSDLSYMRSDLALLPAARLERRSQIVREAAELDDLLHGLRHPRERILTPRMRDYAAGEIDRDLIAFFDRSVQRGALDDRQPVIDSVAIKSTRER